MFDAAVIVPLLNISDDIPHIGEEVYTGTINICIAPTLPSDLEERSSPRVARPIRRVSGRETNRTVLSIATTFTIFVEARDSQVTYELYTLD